MSEDVQPECLGCSPCLEVSNKERNQGGIIWKGKVKFEHWSVFWVYFSPQNPINSKPDGLKPWPKYLQLSSFEFFDIHNFLRPKLTHNLLLKI